jgi:hypothetical protein
VLNISPQEVFFIIVKAREYDMEVSPSGLESGSNPNDDRAVSILEDSNANPTGKELRAALENLNVDQQIDLLALTWIGRGTFDSLKDARAEAANADNANFVRYLMETPQLGDYLEEGLTRLGYSIAEFEEDRL